MRKWTTAAVVAVLALALAGTATASILPPTAKLHGKSLAEWQRAFWEWDASIPTNGPQIHPSLANGPVDCSYAQSGKVWFLETGAGGEVRSCTVPAGTALYVPSAYWICVPEIDGIDFTQCDIDGAFLPEALALSSVFVDGVETKDLRPWSTATGAFDLALPGEAIWEFYFGIELGSSTPFSGTGAGVLVTPLPVGPHTIVVRAVFPGYGEFEIRYEITVVPGKK